MTSVFEFRQSPQFWVPTCLCPPSTSLYSGELQTSSTLGTASWRCFHLTSSHLYQGQSKSSASYCEFKVDLSWVTVNPFEERTDSGVRFGFSLVSALKKADFYVRSKEDLILWLDQLEQICILRDIKDDYTILKQLGSGGQSEVFLGESLSFECKKLVVSCRGGL